MTAEDLALAVWVYLVVGMAAAGIVGTSSDRRKPWQALVEIALFWPLGIVLGVVLYRAQRIAEWRRRRRERQLPRARIEGARGWRQRGV